MRLKRMLFVSAAVAAMTGIMATGALAAEDMTATWNAETQSVEITGCTDKGDANTILVLATADDGSVLTEVTESDIKQINEQSDAYTTVKVGELPAGTYEVRVGGDGTIQSTTFTVGSVDNPYYDDGTVLLGDANGNGQIVADDALIGLDYTVGNTDVSKDTLQALDTNENTQIASDDVLLILDYTVGDTSVLGEKTIGEREHFVGEVLE